MPQLVKGGKWVFGWTVMGPDGRITVPPDAWDEYGFDEGEKALFIPGSQRSGGFGLSSVKLLADFPGRPMAESVFDAGGRVRVPAHCGLRPGDRLLVVRGSGRALGFPVRGPIVEEASKHDLEVYT